MKKIILTVSIAILGIGLQAQQQNRTSLNPTASLTVTDVNKTIAPVQPTYKGGKTYSQWVAEEKAKLQSGKREITQLVAPQKPELANLNNIQRTPSTQTRTPEEIQKAKLLQEASQTKAKYKVEENVTKTQPNPLLIGISTDPNKTVVKQDEEKLKPVEGGGNTPVKKD